MSIQKLELLVDDSAPSIEIPQPVIEAKPKKSNNTELIILLVFTVLVIGVMLYFNYANRKENVGN